MCLNRPLLSNQPCSRLIPCLFFLYNGCPRRADFFSFPCIVWVFGFHLYIPPPRVFHLYIPSFTGFSKNPLSQRKIGVLIFSKNPLSLSMKDCCLDVSWYTPGLGFIFYFYLLKHLSSRVVFSLIVLGPVFYLICVWSISVFTIVSVSLIVPISDYCL